MNRVTINQSIQSSMRLFFCQHKWNNTIRQKSRSSLRNLSAIHPHTLQSFPSVVSPMYSSHRSMSTSAPSDFLCIDAFCMRQFAKSDDPSSSTIDCEPAEFLKKCVEYVDEQKAAGKSVLVDGYAPFCKHIFIPNFTSSTPCYIELSNDIESFVKTSYVARTEKELPVLNRFVSSSELPADKVKPAKYLDLILYSRAQIIEENKAMGTVSNDTAEWGIVSVKVQDHGHETPMQPITMMRNALGTDQGGSGIPLDAELYKQSVEFWSKHISLV